MGIENPGAPKNTPTGEEGSKLSTPEADTTKEMEVDWSAVIRNSFLFSQGNVVLQRCILDWLAIGPLRTMRLDRETEVELVEKVAMYTLSIAEAGKNHLSAGQRSSIDDVSARSDTQNTFRAFEYKQNMYRGFTKERRAEEQESALQNIAKGLIERDNRYLINQGGRPVSNTDSKRDRWSSFIIDFGLLEQGDGFLTWKGTPEPYKEMWREIMPIIETQKDSPDMQAILGIYLEKHPELSPENKQKIESFF